MSSSEKTIEKLETMPDSEIDYSDIPATDKEFWKIAKVKLPQPKKAISLRIDPEVLDWFKAQGKGYQSRMNAVLKAYVKAQQEKIRAVKLSR